MKIQGGKIGYLRWIFTGENRFYHHKFQYSAISHYWLLYCNYSSQRWQKCGGMRKLQKNVSA